jgi:hypothetical protein
MTVVCLVIAQLWACLAVYLSFFVPKRHEVVLHYLQDSQKLIGDVVYQEGMMFGQLSLTRCGHVIYPHPCSDVSKKTVHETHLLASSLSLKVEPLSQVYPVYVRKKVHVLQRYTRERVAIALLPDLPFSGQPKADLELDLAVAIRNKENIYWLAMFSWLWMVFAAVAPIYILLMLGQVGSETEYDMDTIWIIYSVVVGIVIPAIAISFNTLIWNTHIKWLTKGGKILEEGERRDGSLSNWLSNSNSESDYTYEPPSPRDID